MILFLLIVTATSQPAVPTVGDPITVQFEQEVALDPSDRYEVLSQDGNTVVVRTFRPEPFELSGRTGGVFFRKLMVPVTSVLEADDTMEPAPLKPPAVPETSRLPMVAITSAAAVAALAWLAAILLSRRRDRPAAAVVELSAGERYRRTVAELRAAPSRADRWAALADATRAYLAATQPSLGRELTTAELLRAARDSRELIATILHQGDLEKFSPWGSGQADFDAVADDALRLIPAAPAEEADAA